MDDRTRVPRFLGRADELARLHAWLAGALDERPVGVLVAGEAGVGKSRLLGELLRFADLAGARVLEGGCLPAGEATPYVPIVSILRSLSRAVPHDELAAVLGPGRADLGRLAPELLEDPAPGSMPVQEGDPAAQARLFERVAGALDRLARSTPLVVAIEDVQWIDHSSRDVVDFIVRGLRDQRILLVMTLRTDEGEANVDLQAWVAEIARLPRVEQVDLGPLPRHDVAALIATITGREPAAGLVDRLASRSNGNPFLVEELAHAVEAGDGDQDGSSLPAHLRGLLLARVAGLDEEAQAVLRAASAIGTRVDDALLADALELPGSRLASVLRSAVGRGLLVRTDDGTEAGRGYAFRHALLREAVYGELFPGERLRLHGAFAVALERRAQRDPSSVAAGALAHHWDAAGEPARALPAHLAAARDAVRMFAFAEARGHAERALELWGRSGDAGAAAEIDLAGVLERAAEAAALEGDYAAALARVDRAIELVDATAEPARMTILRQHQRWLLWQTGDIEAAGAAVQEALHDIPEDPPSARRAKALADAAGLDMLGGHPRRALAGAREAIRVARAASALPEEALALGVQGLAMAGLGDVEGGVASLRDGMQIARILGSVDGLALGYMNLASLLDRVGRTHEALAAALEGYASVERSGLARTFGGYLLAHSARMHLHLGTWEQAGHLVEEGLALGPVARARLFLLVQRARLAAAQGRAEIAAAAVAGVMELEADLGPTEHSASVLEARIEVATTAGRLTEARDVVDEALRIPTAGRQPDPALAWVGALAMRIEADAAEDARLRRDAGAEAEARGRALAIVGWLRGWLPAGDLANQEAAARRLEPRAAAIVALLEAEHGRLVGEPDPAAWLAAAEAFSAIGRPYTIAYARFRLAASHLARGERAPAAAALAEAHTVARRLGALPLAAAVERLARASRIDLPVPPPAAGAQERQVAPVPAALGLTRRERDVLALLAAGRPDREIAVVLGIRPGTARAHVSRVVAKLGVAGRVEASIAAMRLGLGPDAAGLDSRAEPQRGQTPADAGDGASVRRTFLFTDMVRSTALIDVVGDAAWRDLRRWHDTTLRRLFEQHDGREIDHAGDGFFVSFDRASDAVRCARAIQRTLGEHRRATGFAPSVRIGLHTGEAHPDGKALTGRAVHLAARVAAHAEGGEILASAAAMQEAGIGADARLAEVRLQGIPEPVAMASLPW